MSGEKRRYTRIEDRELRRLREQDSRLRSLQQDLPERLNAVRQQAQQEFQQRLAPLEGRTQRQEQEIAQMRTGIQNLERETNRRFQDQRREYLGLFERQDRKFTALIDGERKAREAGQTILQKQIDEVVQNLASERQQKEELARDLLADIETVWQQVDRDYQHQRFAPGKWADLRRDLDMVAGNIEAGISEAAIATSQQTYLKLSDLRLELEQKEQEWLLYYQAALTDLRSLITEVQSHRECEVEVGEGSDAESFKCEVNYWTNGRLGEYENRLTQLETELVEGEATLTTEQVKNIGEQIEHLRPILGEIIEQAKLSILGSQMRAEIGDRVVEALENMGYTLVDDTYEGEDERNAFVVKVKNVAGDEVVTVVSPESEFGANSVSINAFSPTLIDETATRQNAEAIFNLLNEAGVQGVGEIECKEEAKVEYRDLEEVRHRLGINSQANSSNHLKMIGEVEGGENRI
ncbi:MAG: hypothetical protein ACP5D7_16565 [Limnospira sp.]